MQQTGKLKMRNILLQSRLPATSSLSEKYNVAEPATRYQFTVRGFTAKREGGSSNTVTVETDTDKPSSPTITTANCTGSSKTITTANYTGSSPAITTAKCTGSSPDITTANCTGTVAQKL